MHTELGNKFIIMIGTRSRSASELQRSCHQRAVTSCHYTTASTAKHIEGTGTAGQARQEEWCTDPLQRGDLLLLRVVLLFGLNIRQEAQSRVHGARHRIVSVHAQRGFAPPLSPSLPLSLSLSPEHKQAQCSLCSGCTYRPDLLLVGHRFGMP